MKAMDSPLTGYMHEAMGRIHKHTVPGLVIIQNRKQAGLSYGFLRSDETR